MPNIVVVTGSVRPYSANEKVVPLVVAELKKQGASVTIADLKELNLPFFDAPVPPSSPDFAPIDEAVKQWTRMVAESDGVALVTPEYNHNLSPVQLNAIDWIGEEWSGKPVALIGYGWRSGASQAHVAAREALAENLKAAVGDNQANLFFTKDLNPDATVADGGEALAKIAASVTELLAHR